MKKTVFEGITTELIVESGARKDTNNFYNTVYRLNPGFGDHRGSYRGDFPSCVNHSEMKFGG